MDPNTNINPTQPVASGATPTPGTVPNPALQPTMPLPPSPDIIKPGSLPKVEGLQSISSASHSITKPPLSSAPSLNPNPSLPTEPIPATPQAPTHTPAATHMTSPASHSAAKVNNHDKMSWILVGAALAIGVLAGLGIGYFLLNKGSDLESAYQNYLTSTYPDDQEARDQEYAQSIENIKSIESTFVSQ